MKKSLKEYGVLKSRRGKPAQVTRGGDTSFVNREEERPLTGEVQGQRAAEGEERLARTIEKGISKGIAQQHFFRWTTLKRGTVGYKELDELVFTFGQVIAISVKGEDFVHRSAASKAQDKLNELIIMKRLKELGISVARIESVPASRLKTQKEADKVGRELGIYR